MMFFQQNLSVFIISLIGCASTVQGQVSLTPDRIVVDEGQNAIFACSPFIPGAQPVLQIQRPGDNNFRNTDPLTDSQLTFVMDYPLGSFNPSNRTYQYQSARHEDNGTRFMCTITAIPSNIVILTVSPVCSDPPIIVNGMRTFSGNSVGDTATYNCTTNFELIGDSTTMCTQNDVNSAEFPAIPPPECRPLCSDPAVIVNGMMTFSGNSVGDTATYSCNTGFELIGNLTMACTQIDANSAEFSAISPPECRPLCSDPPVIMNGMRTFNGNSVGDTATYSCNTGFEQIGNLTTACTQIDVNSAEFSAVSPPVCRRPSTDINECSLGTHDCDSNAQCMDTLEGFVCTCNPGYTGDGSSCTDINECARSTHNCHPQARCENTAGGFKCKCRYGYAGNGVSCSDVNECIRSTHNCHRNALCKNTNGGFECSCYEGYVGNGIHCTDVNECISYKNNCNRNARCVNTDGSFRCFCNLGFLGNGVTCTSGAAAVAVDLEEFTSSRTRSRSGTKSASNRSNSGTKSTKMRMG